MRFGHFCVIGNMEDINAQQNIREFSVQSFRKICDAMVLSPPKAVNEAADRDDMRYILLRELKRKVLEYTGAVVEQDEPATRPGEFMQTHDLIETLGTHWRVHSMNLETIIGEFVFNVIDRERL